MAGTARSRSQMDAIIDAGVGVAGISGVDLSDLLASVPVANDRQFDYRSTDIESNNTTFIDTGLQFVLRKRNGVKQIHHCRFEIREFLDSDTVGSKHQWLNVNGATFNFWWTGWRYMRDDWTSIDSLWTEDPTQVHHAPAGTLTDPYIIHIYAVIDPDVYNDGDVIKLQFAQDSTGDAAGAHIMPGSIMFVDSYPVPA